MPNLWNEKPLKADINFNSLSLQEIIPSPGAGKKLAIDFLNFIPAAATNVQLSVGASNYGGSYPLGANQSYVIENAIGYDEGLIFTSTGTAFNMQTSVATQTSGFVLYRILEA